MSGEPEQSHEDDGVTTFDQKTWEFIRELVLKRENERARDESDRS